MFRKLWVIAARWLRDNGGERYRRLASRMMWASVTKRTVSTVRICRPCRHLTVDGTEYDARFTRHHFPVWNEWVSNRWGFRRVRGVGDCRYFRVPVPNWFGKWLRPIVTENNTRDGWWFGNERTENWYRYRDVRVNEERLRAERA
jgi:hypothetical protein